MTTERQPSFVFVPCGASAQVSSIIHLSVAKMHLFFMEFPTIRLVFGRKGLGSVMTFAAEFAGAYIRHRHFSGTFFHLEYL